MQGLPDFNRKFSYFKDVWLKHYRNTLKSIVNKQENKIDNLKPDSVSEEILLRELKKLRQQRFVDYAEAYGQDKKKHDSTTNQQIFDLPATDNRKATKSPATITIIIVFVLLILTGFIVSVYILICKLTHKSNIPKVYGVPDWGNSERLAPWTLTDKMTSLTFTPRIRQILTPFKGF